MVRGGSCATRCSSLLLAAAAVSGLDGRSDRRGDHRRDRLLSVGLGFVNEYRAGNAVAALHARHPPRGARRGATARRSRRRHRPRARRRRRAAGRRHRPGRPAADRGDAARVRRGGAHRGVAARREDDRRRRDRATRRSISRRARSWARSCIRAAGEASSSRPGRRRRSDGSPPGLGEPRPRRRSRSGLRGFSRLLVKVAGVLTISIFVINVALLAPADRRAAVLARDRDRHHAAAPPGDRVGQPLERVARARAQARAREAARHASRTSATSRCCSPTRPGRSPKARSRSDEALDAERALRPDGAPLRTALQRGDACPSGRARRRQRARRRAAGRRRRRGSSRHGRRSGYAAARSAAVRPRAPARVGRRPTRPDGRGAGDEGRARGACSRAARDVPEAAQAALDRLFGDGARVVAVATRAGPRLRRSDGRRRARPRLAGFLTFVDRPKADAGAAIAELAALGIAVKIITGDNGAVAEQGLPRHRPRRRRRR